MFDDIRKIYDELLELAEDIRIRYKSSGNFGKRLDRGKQQKIS